MGNCTSRNSEEKRPSRPFLTKKLKKRMQTGCSEREGTHSFDLNGLAPLVTFAVELGMKYHPEKGDLVDVILGYAALFGEVAVQVFLRENPKWIQDSLEHAFALIQV